MRIQIKNIQLLFTVYWCVVFYIVFLTPNRYTGEKFAPNLIPIINTIRRIHKPAGEHFWAYYLVYWSNIGGNIILFIPFSILLRYLKRKVNYFYILIYGVAISICIEAVQFVLQIGVCDIDDVILNTTGIIAGIVLIRYLENKVDIRRVGLSEP